MKHWHFDKNIIRFEYEYELGTLRLLNWDEYKKFIVPERYSFIINPPKFPLLPPIYPPNISHDWNDMNENDTDDDDDDVDYNIEYPKMLSESITSFRNNKKDLLDVKMAEWFWAPYVNDQYAHYCVNSSEYTLNSIYRIRHLATCIKFLPRSIEEYSDAYISKEISANNSSKTTYLSFLEDELSNKNVTNWADFIVFLNFYITK